MRIWTERVDAVFTRTVPESAGYFRWEGYYENGGFSYFLQTGECAKENRSKIKVSKWIDTPDLTRNQQFTLQWHDLLHAMEERLTGEDEGKQREENLLLLRLFYLLPYEGTIDFYTQFTERMEHWNGQNGQI